MSEKDKEVGKGKGVVAGKGKGKALMGKRSTRCQQKSAVAAGIESKYNININQWKHLLVQTDLQTSTLYLAVTKVYHYGCVFIIHVSSGSP